VAVVLSDALKPPDIAMPTATSNPITPATRGTCHQRNWPVLNRVPVLRWYQCRAGALIG